MRMYNKTTRMAICATKLALSDAKLEPGTTYSGGDIGLLMASTYGHVDVLGEYDRSLVANGVQRTNAALMPFSIPSAPGAMVALSFGLKAFSMTLANGGASAIDALGLGARWLTEGRAKACVVVASFAPGPELILAAARAGWLAPPEQSRILSPLSRGTALGEAAVAFVLEGGGDAQIRAAQTWGYVNGYGAAFAGASQSGLADAARRASTAALGASERTATDVALVSSAASGVWELDAAEAEGLSALFRGRLTPVGVAAHKGSLGETLDAAGALQVLIALASLEKKVSPPIVSLGNHQHHPGLSYLRAPALLEAGPALISAASRGGSCSALVVSRGSREGE